MGTIIYRDQKKVTGSLLPVCILLFDPGGAILPSRPARNPSRRAQRRSRMARLRATAPAARSVLDGREHDGSLHRVGDLPIAPIKPSLKKLANARVKKRAHAQES